jgi:hypothetical protein
MRLEPIYRARFSAPQRWSVELTGPDGSEGQDFLLTGGRYEVRVAASWRGANYPGRRIDGTLTPDFRGVLETDDSATILFAWNGYGRAGQGAVSQLVGGMTHTSGRSVVLGPMMHLARHGAERIVEPSVSLVIGGGDA